MPEKFVLPSRSKIAQLELDRAKFSQNTGKGVGTFFKQSPAGRIDSECISDYQYDLETQTLTIEFVKRGTYQYYNVSVWTITEFGFSGSRGKYFNDLIRGLYAYNRIA